MTNNTSSNPLCEEVRDELARLVDGTAARELYDHVADCDTCRDLRHDASTILGFVKAAGGDYQPTNDLESALMAALDARAPSTAEPPKSATIATAAAEVAAPIVTEILRAETVVTEVAHAAPVTEILTTNTEVMSTSTSVGMVDAEVLSSRTIGVESSRSTQPSEVSPSSSAAPSSSSYVPDPRGYDGSTPVSRSSSKKEPGKSIVVATPSTEASSSNDKNKENSFGGKVIDFVRRRPRTIGFAGAAIFAVAAAAAAALSLGGGAGGLGLRVAGDPWTGSVAAIGRATAAARDGLTLCNASGSSCTPADSGTAISAGALLRTDARTRAELHLTDGTSIVLDRSSELVLDASDSRTARLTRGALVADVAHLDHGPNARINIPGGKLEVLGTKFAVFSDTDRSRVEVTRGVVQLTDDKGKSERVFAGEEGRLASGRAVSVSPTTALGEVVELSEIKPTANTAGSEVKEEPVRGLGELRAKKPGQNDERDQVVRLAKHDVKVRIVDNVARTEIDETFQNDSGDELEGIYRFPLPPDAQIEKLSLEVNGKLEEGAFVEKDRAAAIWRGVIQHATPQAPKPVEEIVWVPGPWRDPALLEWKRGGRFELRIFPIPRNGSRRIVISYTQTVAPVGGMRRYTYPLPFDARGTAIDTAHFDVQVLGHDRAAGVRPSGYTLTSAQSESGERFEMSANRFVPSGDLTLEYALPDRDRELTAWAYQAPASAIPAVNPTPLPGRPIDAQKQAPVDSNQPYVVLALQPKLPRTSDEQPRDHVLLVDTSRSMVGERFTRARSVAESIIREMSSRDRVLVLACDTSCQGANAGFSSPGDATAESTSRFLKSISPDGAADLSAMVRAARLAADSGPGADSKRPLHVVYIGDGGASAGPTRPDHLTAEIQRLLPGERGALTAAAIGADADTVLLAAMARGGGGVVIPYVPGQRAAVAAMGVLGASYGSSLRTPELVLPAGFTQVAPATLDTIRPGTETLVVARMTDPSIEGEVVLKGKVGKDAFEQRYPLKVVATSEAGNAFVPRQFAATRIADLERSGGDATKTAIIDLSKRFAVASRYTSLLVLESEAMFSAFGLDRRRNAPTWTGESAASNTSADGSVAVPDAADDLSVHTEERGVGGGRSRASGKAAMAADAPMTASPDFGGDVMGDPFNRARPAAPAPTATFAPAKPVEMDKEKKDFGTGAARGPVAQPARRPPPRGGMIAMKRVYDRKGQVLTDLATWHSTDTSKMIAAENASLSRPDARQTTRDLFGQYALHGRLDQASQVAERWSSRDALDPDALIARADIAARNGDRTLAIRILGGVADVRPDDATAQNRLATLYDLAGDASKACAHRIALAEQRSTDAPANAAAIRCARATGLTTLADRILADLPSDRRTLVDAELAKTPEDPTTLRGDVQLDATWEADVDLDIALIDPSGNRLSWLGGGKSKATARTPVATRAESLALSNLAAGNYVVEVTRTGGSDSIPVNGSITLRVVGETRKIPFTLAGNRTEVSRVLISYTSRLVQIDNGWGEWDRRRIPFDPF